jgi:guanosine-3',5'-bis(diphosphate) 3'-pyrophosphohydrolase
MTASDDGITLVLRAAQFAAHKHRDQRREDAAATPYINHPLELANVLVSEGGVTDPVVLAAALVHDTIEDTQTSYEELRSAFGTRVADIVIELTDTKFLSKKARKRLQVARAGHATTDAGQVKIADKLCNLRDVLAGPPKNWSLKRKREYFEWAKEVVDQVREDNPRLARKFDALYRQRPL